MVRARFDRPAPADDDVDHHADNPEIGVLATNPAIPRPRRTPRKKQKPRPPRPRDTVPETIGRPTPPAASEPTRPATGSPTPPAPSGPNTAPTNGGLSVAAASSSATFAMPVAGMAMQSLALMAAQYGSGEPTVIGAGVVPTVVNGAPSTQNGGIALYDGPVAQASAGTSRRAEALEHLNSALTGVLNGTAGTTTFGRTRIGDIISDVDSALTALGAITDTPTGRSLAVSAVDNALERAGVVMTQGHSDTAVAASKIAALTEQYLREASGSSGHWIHRRRYGYGIPLTRPTGTVGEWIDQALQVLGEHGYNVDMISPGDIGAIIAHESGGNPVAINLWDSNAAAGHPSIGLMQTIGPTFNAHALPGHDDIWNPVDNIIAGVRYAISRYGSVAAVPGVIRLHEGESYVGY